jgi:methylglutaconyl-CoA hydratase
MVMTKIEFTTIRLERIGAVARLVLARPQVHNAFNETMIAELAAACEAVRLDASARVLVLAAEGKSFSAGADVDWMRRMAGASQLDNEADAARLSAMLHALDNLGKPVVARIHGAALGGGTGLAACADVVVALKTAKFGTTEVRLGILPSVIGPFMLRKIGASWCRAHFLMGDRFDAEEAHRMGLVHALADDEAGLDQQVDRVVCEILAGSPAAQAEAKKLLRALQADADPQAQRALTAQTIARVRASAEGQEGLNAFIEKRKPAWFIDGSA